MDVLLPFAAAVLTLRLAAALARRWRESRAPELVAWSVSLACFAAASGALAWGAAAAGRGLRVVVAGAGGAAHLPGMLASVTPLPVVGVPVPLRHLDGMDSLLSIVQMPAGVPVATVGVGAARNAGLLK